MLKKIQSALHWRAARLLNNQAIQKMAATVASQSPPPNGKPVIFFNTSSRLGSMSLNASYSLLTSWSLQLSGVPVINVYCRQGMTRCIHGTNREDPQQLPPCQECIHQSEVNFSNSASVSITYEEDAVFEEIIQKLTLQEMEEFIYDGIPLGNICRSSLRWVMRRYHLQDEPDTMTLYRHYLRSAWNIARQFDIILDEQLPQALVVFNGIVYPEATARHLAEKRGIRVISHEVNLQPFTAFFTDQEATFRATPLPSDFALNKAQIEQFNQYFTKRTKGQFQMAGVTFWKDISDLDELLLTKMDEFQQTVSVFTNVIFDTSQEHANTFFPHMFAWLDHVLETVKENPQTLFVLRAHPDEDRPGKASQESVADWVRKSGWDDLPNTLFYGPRKSINSYELIQRSKFCLVYTSTIGMEASLLDTPVICVGRAYYNEHNPAGFTTQSMDEYHATLQQFLAHPGKINAPKEHQVNARNFLYYQLFRTSLPFDDFITEDGAWAGYVKLKKFPWQALLPENSTTMQVIQDGIMHAKPFVLPE
jgi:hypothetical protein